MCIILWLNIIHTFLFRDNFIVIKVFVERPYDTKLLQDRI